MKWGGIGVEWPKSSRTSFRNPNGITLVALRRLAERNLVSPLKFGPRRNGADARNLPGFATQLRRTGSGPGAPLRGSFTEAAKEKQSVADVGQSSVAIGYVLT